LFVTGPAGTSTNPDTAAVSVPACALALLGLNRLQMIAGPATATHKRGSMLRLRR
jgi:hypothetical protein